MTTFNYCATMKKTLFFVAVATLFFFSCQRENVALDNYQRVTFKASIDALETKANINATQDLIWADGDKIGVYVNNDWADKNQPFVLTGSAGSTSGDFEWEYETSTNHFPSDVAIAAFFPWQGQDTDNNNSYWDGNVYFKLKNYYDNYTSGQMLTPLVAPIVQNGSSYDPIAFKHAGAAVKVTVNNLPKGVKSAGMIADQQVWGNYHIDLNATGNLTLDDSANSANNQVWFNFSNDAESAFTFLFPVPALNTPVLTFKFYDINGVLVWEKTTPAQPSIAKGQVLDMGAINITAYRHLTLSTEYTVIGTANSSSWDVDFPMLTDGVWCVAKGLTFAAGGAFKVRQDKSWDSGKVFPGDGDSNNVIVPAAGTYDIFFEIGKPSSVKYVLTGSCPYPAASGIGKGNDLGDPSVVTGTIF